MHFMVNKFINPKGNNCVQNFHLGRYIIGYTVENSILQPQFRGAIKRDFQTLILRYTSSNEIFEYGYPHPNALVTFFLQKDSKKIVCCAYVKRLPAA